MKYLIIYNAQEVTSVTDYLEGTAVVTPYSFMVDTLTQAGTMLAAMGVDIKLIDEYGTT